MHFDAVPAAPVGSEGVLRDFGALESGLLAQVGGDIGVGVEFVELLHLIAVGTIGETVLARVAEFEEEQEHKEGLGLRDGEHFAAVGVWAAAQKPA
jgi:hypothetical protein